MKRKTSEWLSLNAPRADLAIVIDNANQLSAKRKRHKRPITIFSRRYREPPNLTQQSITLDFLDSIPF